MVIEVENINGEVQYIEVPDIPCFHIISAELDLSEIPTFRCDKCYKYFTREEVDIWVRRFDTLWREHSR